MYEPDNWILMRDKNGRPLNRGKSKSKPKPKPKPKYSKPGRPKKSKNSD